MALVKTRSLPTVKPVIHDNYVLSKMISPKANFERNTLGTYVGEDGLLKYADTHQPRFDHDPETGKSLGLLIEGEYQNQVTYSNELWRYSISALTITQNYGDAPDGTRSAAYYQATTANSLHQVYIMNLSATTDYIVSVFAKAGNEDRIALSVDGVSASIFDLSTGTESGTTGGRIQKFPNGWYRISRRVSTGASSRAFVIRLRQNSGYTGSNEGLYLWGAQAEVVNPSYTEQAIPSSLIPTYGASAVRGPDNLYYNASEVGLDNYGQPMTVLFEGRCFGSHNEAPYNYPLYVSATSGSGYILLHQNPPQSPDTMQCRLAQADGTVVFNNSPSLGVDQEDYSKFSARFESDRYAVHTSGITTIQVDNGGTFNWTPLKIYIGNTSGYNRPYNGWIKYAYIWNTGLSNDEMHELTRTEA